MLRVTLFVATLLMGLLSATTGTGLPQARAQEATPAASCPVTSQEENEAVARRWYEDALNGADLAVLDEILSPDVVVYHSGSLATQDLAGIKDVVLAPILVGFPDVTYTIDQAISDDDDVVLIWHAEGTHTGEFQGFPASGKHATWTGINAMRFECGKIVEVWAEFNALGRLQQIGAIATPTP
jgi:steroid delta-isomerase-like uncharacterized protein